jgi:hypothetical protein
MDFLVVGSNFGAQPRKFFQRSRLHAAAGCVYVEP